MIKCKIAKIGINKGTTLLASILKNISKGQWVMPKLQIVFISPTNGRKVGIKSNS